MLLTPKSLSPQLAKVHEVCRNSESMSKELEERLIQKYEAYEENRKTQLQSVVKRLQDHVRNPDFVQKFTNSSSTFQHDFTNFASNTMALDRNVSWQLKPCFTKDKKSFIDFTKGIHIVCIYDFIIFPRQNILRKYARLVRI
jgi:hypothetical protein